MSSYLFKKNATRLFCNKILKEYEACKQWSASLKSLGTQCANKLYNKLSAEKEDILPEDEDNFLKSSFFKNKKI